MQNREFPPRVVVVATDNGGIGVHSRELFVGRVAVWVAVVDVLVVGAVELEEAAVVAVLIPAAPALLPLPRR